MLLHSVWDLLYRPRNLSMALGIPPKGQPFCLLGSETRAVVMIPSCFMYP
jgi:hypothetical protein